MSLSGRCESTYTFKTLPKFYTNTKLYKSFDIEDIDEIVPVDDNYIIDNLHIFSYECLNKLIESIDYWGFDVIPRKIYNKIIKNIHLIYFEFPKFKKTGTLIEIIENMIPLNKNQIYILYKLSIWLEIDSTIFLRYLISNNDVLIKLNEFKLLKEFNNLNKLIVLFLFNENMDRIGLFEKEVLHFQLEYNIKDFKYKECYSIINELLKSNINYRTLKFQSEDYINSSNKNKRKILNIPNKIYTILDYLFISYIRSYYCDYDISDMDEFYWSWYDVSPEGKDEGAFRNISRVINYLRDEGFEYSLNLLLDTDFDEMKRSMLVSHLILEKDEIMMSGMNDELLELRRITMDSMKTERDYFTNIDVNSI